MFRYLNILEINQNIIFQTKYSGEPKIDIVITYSNDAKSPVYEWSNFCTASENRTVIQMVNNVNMSTTVVERSKLSSNDLGHG